MRGVWLIVCTAIVFAVLVSDASNGAVPAKTDLKLEDIPITAVKPPVVSAKDTDPSTFVFQGETWWMYKPGRAVVKRVVTFTVWEDPDTGKIYLFDEWRKKP